MPVAPDKDRVVATVSKEEKEALEQLAQADKRSLSNYIAKVLQEHIREALKNEK